MKRGQVTYFIIAGLIVLLAVILIFSARLSFLKDVYEGQRTKLLGVPADIKPVGDYVQGCLDQTANDAIVFVMLQGGYVEPSLNPGVFIGYNSVDIPYWYYNNEDTSSNITDIEYSISSYAENVFPTCIDSVKSNFKDYTIDYTTIFPKTSIKGDKVLIDINTDIKVNYKEKTYSLKNFKTNPKTDVIDVFDEAKTIFNKVKINNQLSLDEISNLKYNIKFFYTNELSVIYSISSNNTIINFAVKFEEITEENEFIREELQNITL